VSRRSGLGRGLGSLIPTDVGSGDVAGALRDLPVSSIVANPRQPRNRFDEESLVSLTDSVRELGVLQPVLVRQIGETQFELIAGERRWRAARRAGLPTIPAIVREVDDQRSLEEALVENLHRQDLNPLEEAAAYQSLLEEHGLTQDHVAQRVGKSRSAVANAVRLFQLPGSVQRLVATGEISAGHARALLGTPDRAFQERLAGQIVDVGLTVRQVEELVRDHQAELADDETPDRPVPAPAPRSASAVDRPAALLELEDLLGDRLATRVHVAMAKGRGRVTIEFADLEDLERIYRIMVEGELDSPQSVDNGVYNA
jgi:ParB family transcriptional regulator, chromosome partitioning protein